MVLAGFMNAGWLPLPHLFSKGLEEGLLKF